MFDFFVYFFQWASVASWFLRPEMAGASVPPIVPQPPPMPIRPSRTSSDPPQMAMPPTICTVSTFSYERSILIKHYFTIHTRSHTQTIIYHWRDTYLFTSIFMKVKNILVRNTYYIIIRFKTITRRYAMHI